MKSQLKWPLLYSSHWKVRWSAFNWEYSIPWKSMHTTFYFRNYCQYADLKIPTVHKVLTHHLWCNFFYYIYIYISSLIIGWNLMWKKNLQFLFSSLPRWPWPLTLVCSISPLFYFPVIKADVIKRREKLIYICICSIAIH